MQAAIRRDIHDMAPLPSEPRGENSRKCDGAGEARALDLMNTTGRQAAVRQPAIYRISNRDGVRKPGACLVEAIDLLTELFQDWICGHVPANQNSIMFCLFFANPGEVRQAEAGFPDGSSKNPSISLASSAERRKLSAPETPAT